MLKSKTTIALAIIFSLTLIGFVNSIQADSITSIGPGPGSENYLFTGDIHYGHVLLEVPFDIVYWYIKGPDDEGHYGTVVDIDFGDGTATDSDFSYTFNEGSTSGEEYKITAYVYSGNNEILEDFYTVGVWTPADEVITTPDELTITDDIKIGDYYEFVVEASSASSNYVFSDVEVQVNGKKVAERVFTDAANLSLNVAGIIPENVGASITVTVIAKGGIKSTLAGRLVPAGIIIFALEKTWEGMLKGTVEGECKCPDDDDPLDSAESTYTCTDPNTKYKFHNLTKVKWFAVDGPLLCSGGGRKTLNNGRYSFVNKVPFGYDIILTLSSTDLHVHTRYDEYYNKLPDKNLICVYNKVKNIGKIGKVILKKVPYSWGGGRDRNFYPLPETESDPCLIPYNERIKL